MEGPGSHPLARRRDARQLGNFLLPAGRGGWRVLVRGPPADPAAGRPVRGRVLRCARRVPQPEPPDRQLYRSRGLARGRCRTAPPAVDQHQPDAQDDRGDELRRGRACHSRRRRTAPGVQQPLRADRGDPRPAHHPLHQAPAFERRIVAVDVPPDVGARPGGGDGLSYETDRLRFVGRGSTPADSARDARPRAALRHPGVGARSHRRDPRPLRAGT